MRKLIILIPIFFLLCCSSVKNIKSNRDNLTGVYFLESDKLFQALSDKNYSKIVIQEDGIYDLYKAEISFTPVVEQCEYASIGKWTMVEENVIQITSENYYTKQKGFEYDIKKENKFSQDSLYIQVVFSTDFHPVKVNFTFNNSKSISTDKMYTVLPKSKYLWNRRTATNQISFSLNANVSGAEIYKSRVLFEIFEESIDTEKYNYLTIILPNFDRCFFEFEPFYQDLLLVKDKNRIMWQGEVWKK